MRLLFAIVCAVTITADEKENTDWKAGPGFAPLVGSDPKVTFGKDMITLQNRGCIVSKKEFPDGLRLRMSWQWTKGNTVIDGQKYYEVLCVVVRTDGKLREAWAHEIEEGIVARFSPNGNSLTLERWELDKEVEVLDKKENVQFALGQGYNVVVVDKKTSIEVYFGDDKSPTLKANVDPKLGKRRHVAIYDREGNANVLKESVLSFIEITPLK